VFYLHGFASSSKSSKAAFFGDHLQRHGLMLRCPDFNEPDFASLTMTRMLEQLEHECAAISGGRIAVIGSSLGGALAILAAEHFGPRLIDRLVLLAPAVMFAKPGHHLLPDERIAEWRADGATAFFHYGYGEPRRLNFAFYEDAQHYEPFAANFAQ